MSNSESDPDVRKAATAALPEGRTPDTSQPTIPTQSGPNAGDRLADGRYEIVEKLGEGGMGTVYLAMQHPIERKVVVKLIHSQMVGSSEVLNRFTREMLLTARIEHPNTVRVYDSGVWNRTPFLVTEFIAGIGLDKLIETQAPLGFSRVVQIGQQIARALHAIHCEGIVHRDLKPSNVMIVDRYGEADLVKVLDFGIAKPLLDDVDDGAKREALVNTATGMLIGTPAYMSPEQCEGVSIDARSDLYGLGLLLFEMFTSRRPFPESTLTGFILAHTSKAPPRLLEIAPDMPPEFDALVTALLEKDRNLRPSSAKVVMDALGALAARPDLGNFTALVPPRSNVAPQAVLDLTSAPGADENLGTGYPPTDPAWTMTGASVPASQRQGARANVIEPDAGLDISTQPPGMVNETTRRSGARASAPRRAGKRLGFVFLGLALCGGLAATYFARVRGDGQRATAADPWVALRARLVADDEPPIPATCLSDGTSFGAAPRATLERVTADLPASPSRSPANFEVSRGALENVPDTAFEKWLLLGRFEGERARRLEALKRAVTLCPEAPLAHNLLGNSLQMDGQSVPARLSYESAIALDGAYMAPVFNLALLELRQQRFEPALRRLQSVYEKAPAYPNLMAVMVDALLAMQRPEAAATFALKALEDHADVIDQIGEEAFNRLFEKIHTAFAPGDLGKFCDKNRDNFESLERLCP